MNPSKKPHTKIKDLLRGRQLGFAPAIIILIVVVLIAAGGTGYYFYKTSQDCEKITYSNEKALCYLSVAIEARDSSLCEKISEIGEAYGKDQCYFAIAMKIKNSRLCRKITNSILKDQCYIGAQDD